MTSDEDVSREAMDQDGKTSSHATNKTRRSHRKSRNGCSECKRRHIRCDERQPECANCEIARRVCFFPIPPAGRQTPKRLCRAIKERRKPSEAIAVQPASHETHSGVDTARNESNERVEQSSLPARSYQSKDGSNLAQPDLHRSRRSSPTCSSLLSMRGPDAESYRIRSSASIVQSCDAHPPASGCCPGLITDLDVVAEVAFTSQHLILLHHARTVPNFLGSHNRNVINIAIRHVVDSPYLLDEILASTAFHLTSVYPGSAPYLRRLATELQTRALASFTRLTEALPYDDEATAVSRFLFSCILGRHVLADALVSCGSDCGSFLDRFVECINLNRGVKAVTPPARYFLYDSEIQPFLSVMCKAEAKILSPGSECEALGHLMDQSDLNEVSIQACRQAIVVLQRSFDICKNLDEADYPGSASVFSVQIGADFVDVLRKHRPEALVILAYYGVLLYRCRTFWAFKESGATMIRAIARQLGTYWQKALAWPLHVLELEHNAET